MGLFKKDRISIPPPPKPEPRENPLLDAPPSFLREAEVRTSLGPDAVISGRLSFTTPTRIEGKLKGEVRCTTLLVIGETAVVEGTVRSEEVRIEGLVRGDVVETKKVEIAPTGRVHGRLEAATVIVREGGFFDGPCHMSKEDGRRQSASNG